MAKGQKFVVMKLVVEGLGTFPIDMLRYDTAAPATESDSHALMDSGFDTEKRQRQVTLRRFAREDDRNNHHAERRWESYGWRVVTYDFWE